MSPTEPIPVLRCEHCGSRLESTGDRRTCLACALAGALDQPPENVLVHEAVPEGHGMGNPALRRFGEYELLAEVARGGMGVVYRARHLSLGRIVALKMVLFGTFARTETQDRFRAEARTGARLKHPHIVPIHDFGTLDGQPWFTMDLIDGPNLGDVLKQGPFPSERAALLMKDLAESVAYAHREGVLHRDLKPSNILLDAAGAPHLTDFGLAREVNLDSSLTLSGQALGSPNYMAPEQAIDARNATARADLWSLGAILYHLLTGRPPFVGATVTETLRALKEDEPLAPRTLNAGTPRDLETICLKCLQKEPEGRYASAQDLADDLGRFLDHQPVHARPVGRIERGWRWCRRRPALAAASGIVLLLALVVSIGSPLAALHIRRERDRAEAYLYASDMNLAYQAYRDNNLGRASVLLERHRPDDGRDRRGWEWHYLNDLCRSEERATLARHSNFVVDLAVSPDGHWVASGGLDHSVRLTDLVTGHTLTNFMLPDQVMAVAFSPDGGELAAGTYNEGLVRRWALPAFRPLNTLTNEEAIQRVAYSPDGHLLVAAGREGSALWNIASAERLGRWPTGHPSLTAVGIAFSPDGRQLALDRGDGSFLVIDVATRKETARIPAHEGPVRGLAYSPDGRRLYSAGDRTVCCWAVADWTPLFRFTNENASVTAMALSQEGQTLATGSEDQHLRLWDAENGKPLARFQGHGHQILGIAFLPAGRGLVSASADGTVRLWPATPPPAPPTSIGWTDKLDDRSGLRQLLVLSPDGSFLGTAYTNNTFSLWNTDTLTESPRWLAPVGSLQSLAIASGGKLMALGGGSGEVRLWDAAAGVETEALLNLTNRVHRLQFSPDGSRLAVKTFDDWSLRVVDLKSHRMLRFESPASDYAMVVAFDAGNRRVAIGNYSPAIEVFTLDGARPPLILRGHALQVRGVVFLPGDRLASASADGTVRIWDLASGQEVQRADSAASLYSSLAASPDGRRLAASAQGGVQLWDAENLQELLTFTELKPGGITVGFHADGRALVGASQDTLRVWRTRQAPPGDSFPR